MCEKVGKVATIVAVLIALGHKALKLVGPDLLLYGLAGWTGASFDYQNLTDNLFFQADNNFWANGATFGGGAEHKVGPNWTVRAEYRFTRFEDKDVDNTFQWSSNSPSSQTNTIATDFKNEMHVGRVAVTRYFTLGD
jgi:outer membrane immunogenic protein